jgi:Outer membrane protein beta-barrel family/CarboxypepD_reg-like domain
MCKAIFTTVCLLIYFSVTAQTIIKGKITDHKKVGIPSATVLLLANKDSSLIKGQVTNTEGLFEIMNILTGTYILQVEVTGYETAYRDITITAQLPAYELETITMNPYSGLLKEVVVTGRRRLFENQVDRTVFNVQNSPGAAALNALEVLARSPNISIDQLNNQILLNGKQGVMVLLNGKPMRMEQSALLQYLGGLSAANIKKIEFIHTPPASMDAAGNAGVINIETIKKEDEGFNGNWTLNAGYGERAKYGGTFAGNFRSNKLNIFSDFSFNSNYTRQDLSNKISNTQGNITTATNLFSKRPPFTGLQNGRIGLDYQLNNKTTLGILISGYRTEWKMDARTATSITNDTGYYSLSNLVSKETNTWKHLMGNFNLQHSFSEKSALNIDIDYLYYSDNNPTSYQDETFDKEGKPVSRSDFRSRKKTPIRFQVANIDYSKTINEKIKIQAGVKGTRSEFTNDVGVDRLINNNWSSDIRFTDISQLKESIGAVFFSTDYQPKEGLFLRIGFRYEQTKSDLTGAGNKPLLQLNYGRIFPSLSFSKRLPKEKQIQFSYNERITRPPFNTIAPAFFFFGPNSIVGGNPAVRPTINRQLTTSYQVKNLLLTLQLSAENRPIVFQPGVESLDGIVILRAENMKTAKTMMLSANYTTSVKWWSGIFNLAVYAQQLQPVVNGKTLTRRDAYFTTNTTQSFKLPASTTIELSNQTTTSRNYGLGKSPFSTSFNLTAQQQINKKNKLALSWTDIFNTGTFLDIHYNQPEQNIQYDFMYEYEGSILKLSFVHQFGNEKVKKRSRKSASEEELKRVN